MNERMKVLIAYDGSQYADAALDDLRHAGLPREAEALIVSVSDGVLNTSFSLADIAGTALTSRRVTSATSLAREQAAQALEEAKKFAAQASERVRSYFPAWEVRVEGITGNPVQELKHRADEWKPDLVVVGSQGRSALGRFLLGSVSTKLATEARSSVRIARRRTDKSHETPPRIMVGVDGSPNAVRAVRSVGSRVWPEGTEARIVAVVGSDNEEAATKARQTAEWAADELRALGLRVSVAIEKGEPQSVLLEEARKSDADSIFVGSRGLDHPDERFGLGNVSTGLVTNATCTVEIVR